MSSLNEELLSTGKGDKIRLRKAMRKALEAVQVSSNVKVKRRQKRNSDSWLY